MPLSVFARDAHKLLARRNSALVLLLFAILASSTKTRGSEMLSEVEIRTEAQLCAMKYMIALSAAKYYLLKGTSVEEVRQLHIGQRQMLGQQAFGLESPEEDDHFASEVQVAVEEIQVQIETLLDQHPRE
jgi:hypothetical protein